jgi:hypothetical protein
VNNICPLLWKSSLVAFNEFFVHLLELWLFIYEVKILWICIHSIVLGRVILHTKRHFLNSSFQHIKKFGCVFLLFKHLQFIKCFKFCCRFYYIIFGLYIATHLPMTMKWQKRNRGLHLKKLLFSNIYIGFKLYKISPNYHPRGDLTTHIFNSLKI